MQIQKQLQSEHRDVASSATRTTVERLLAGIREMAPAISARAAEIEAGRRMPLDLVEALKAIGVFRIFVPRSHGGLELDLPAALEIIEALGRIDGSVGWTAMISGGCDLYASLLSPESYEQVYRKGPDVIIAGSAQPAGTADATAGGWRVNGRWPFASSCQHADWIFGFCIMTEDGKPLAGEDGAPLVRGFLLPARRGRGRSAGGARVSPGPGREPLAPCARRDAEGRGAAHAGHAGRDLGRHRMRRRRRCMLHAGRRQRDL